jgi:hypothetical protein
MRRREFIKLIGGAAAWPLAARPQQPEKVYRIGFLANDPTIPQQPAGRAFLDGLRESGLMEGANIVIERRFAEGRLDRPSELANELVRLNVELIVASSPVAAIAAKQATKDIPIVFVNVLDPVGIAARVVLDLGPRASASDHCSPAAARAFPVPFLGTEPMPRHRPPSLAVDHIDLPPSGIRSLHSDPRCSPNLSGHDGTRLIRAYAASRSQSAGTRLPASPAARAPQEATPPHHQSA